MLNERLHENKVKRKLVSPFRPLLKKANKTLYVKLEYRYITHHKLNLKNPQRYTEKLQVLRLFDYPSNDLVIKCADRVEVRNHFKEIGLEKYLIPILGVYESFDDIPFDKLPHSFVMKCSHACGYNIIVENKDDLNKEEAKKKFEKWLKTNYGNKTIERHYSPIKPRIIIEKYLGKSPLEYKIHVFNGKARYFYLVSGRGTDIRYNNYLINFTPFDGAQFNGWNKSETKFSKPTNWDEMVKISERIGKDFPFVRVDLYNIDGTIYFGETTFTPAKGTLIFDDDKVDYEIGSWLSISK